MSSKVAGPRGIADELVKAKTGRSLGEWFGILDRWAKQEQLPKPKPDSVQQRKWHTKAAKFLNEQYPKVGGWWSQTLVVRYEWHSGFRTKVHRD